jgi:hypothetical protein
MAESNATQVILTDDGIKIIKAQNTADNAAGGVTNLNDPNLMSVIEKQNNIGQFAGLTSQYNVLLQNAKDDGIDTTAVTKAYNNLNQFMASVLADPGHASDINRATYKKYQDAYNEELAKLQNALQNNTNDKFTSAASATSQAASTANVAKSAADSTYKYANSEMAVQSTATAKAQSTADNAFSQATTAIDNGKVTSQAVTDLKDGSKLTIAELENGLATKVANSDYASYKEQTASQIGQLVTNGAFSAYQTQTADLISQKVATKDFSAYQATTAEAIESKVESKDFNTYKTQTADAISQTVTNAISNISIGGTNLIANSANDLIADDTINKQGWCFLTIYNGLIAGQQYTFSSDVKVNTGNVAQIRVRTINDGMTSNGPDEIVNIVNGHISWTFTAVQDKPRLLVYAGIDSETAGNKVTFHHYQLEKGNKATDWTPAPEDQATQSQITQLSDDINLRVTKDGLISQINIQARNTLISSGGQLTLSGKNVFIDSNDPVIMKSANIDKLLVGKKLTAADIAANTFTTNNGTFTVKQDGSVTAKSMTLIGGTLSSPTINTSKINGSTINGTTFNGGDRINNANNTAGYYPMTITPDGAYKSTYFDSAVGLQSSVESGAISYKYRSMIGNGAYSYDNVAINGQGITLDSGTTTTKDTNFSAAETETAYISLTTEAGLYLHGSNANIDFGGHLNDDSTSVGMYMNPYGNLIAKSASQYWQISVAGSDNTGGGVVARFGIDNASAYNIEFNRELDIGNFQINTGHTFTSADGGAIHFAKGRGGANDIYAGDVHYNSLVKSSLLSVKKDVQRADTAYWAQLVNSIDLATYQYKSDDNTSHLRLSSIVDDVNDTKQWQLPDVFISRDEDGKLNGVDDSVLLNATLATVQEQQKEIDQLNGHNMELEARLNKLEAKLNG